jgi:hypothetical protein
MTNEQYKYSGIPWPFAHISEYFTKLTLSNRELETEVLFVILYGI